MKRGWSEQSPGAQRRKGDRPPAAAPALPGTAARTKAPDGAAELEQ